MGRKKMNEDIKSVVFSEEELKKRVRELAQEISRDYKNEELITVGILKGAAVFYTDLVREMDVPVEMDFMVLSSYGSSTVSTGAVRILFDLEGDITGKNVLIIEDIVDTGLTLHYLTKTLKSRNPKSLKVCCLLDKKERRKADFTPDYTGYVVPDEFLVGYGLDYAEKYRNLKYIGVLKPEIYNDNKE
jgi:hypoxanthine phosphoribosyltransferase